MPIPSTRLAGVTRENRLIATDAAKQAIAECGGWIEDFQLFSNKMTCIRFEVPACQAPTLAQRLDQARIVLDQQSREHACGLVARDGDARMTLQITFIHDEPDLRREVLAVPG